MVIRKEEEELEHQESNFTIIKSKIESQDSWVNVKG
jgi:hypothetical protein